VVGGRRGDGERRGALRPWRRALRELEARVRELEMRCFAPRPGGDQLEVDLTELEESAGAAREDPELAHERWLLRRRIRRCRSPTPTSYIASTPRAANLDRQWCVAQALVALGGGEPRAGGRLSSATASRGSFAARGRDPRAWQAWLMHPGAEPLTGRSSA
jgi:hypothetical protein